MKFSFVYPNSTKTLTPQMGILALASFLLERNVDVSVCDMSFVNDGLYLKLLDEHLAREKPDVLAISCRLMEYSVVQSLLRELKKRSQRPLLLVGGPHATTRPESFTSLVDFGVRGEGEEACLEIAQAVDAGRPADIADLPNVFHFKDGKPVLNPLRPLFDLSRAPFPRYEIFDERHYRDHYVLRAIPERRVCGTVEGSRGCPFRCTYCSNATLMDMAQGKGRWRREKPASMLREEIKRLKTLYDIDLLYFVDEVIMTSDQRTADLREHLHDLNVPFTFMERPELVRENRVRDMKSAGATWCSLGVESGNHEFRKALLKRTMPDESIRQAFQMMHKYGIKTHAFTMVGLPNQTPEIMRETFQILEEIQPNSAQATVFFPLPNTQLEILTRENGLLPEGVSIPQNYYARSVLNYSEPYKLLVERFELVISLGLWRKKTNRLVRWLALNVPHVAHLMHYWRAAATNLKEIGLWQTASKVWARLLPARSV
jgi:magnesium-protoporphyrin IX monomethyl ester (oxidative) cyclase